MKGLMVIALFLIVASLGSALTSMTAPRSGPEQSLRMVHALTLRIALSVGLFVLLLVGYHFGWIEPHNVR